MNIYDYWSSKEAAKEKLLRKLAERFSDDAEIAALVWAAWGDGK